MTRLFLLLCSLAAATTLYAQDCSTADHTVLVGNYYFNPYELTIAPGETVGFVNEGGFHDINGNVSVLTGESFGNPETFSLPAVYSENDNVCMGTITLTLPGTYGYDCSIGSHAANGMVGNITVFDPTILGCTDPTACNYSADATDNDDSCVYALNACETCEDGAVVINDLDGDGICDFPGCTSYFASNYNPVATYNDTTCNYDLQQLLIEGTTISDLLFSGVLEEELIGKFAAGGVIVHIDSQNSRALIGSAHSDQIYFNSHDPSNSGYREELTGPLLAEELIGYQFGEDLYDGQLNWKIIRDSYAAKYGWNTTDNGYNDDIASTLFWGRINIMGKNDWFIPNAAELSEYTIIANEVLPGVISVEWPMNPNGSVTTTQSLPCYGWEYGGDYNEHGWATSSITNAGAESNFITNEYVYVHHLAQKRNQLGNLFEVSGNDYSHAAGYTSVFPMRIEELDDVNTSISCKDWDYNDAGNQAVDAGLTCFYPLFNCDSTESDVWNELVIGVYPATASVVEYGRSDTRDILINIPETHEIDGNIYEVIEYEVTGIANIPTGLEMNLEVGDIIAGGDAYCLGFSEYALEEGIYDLDIDGTLYMNILGSTLTADITLEHRVVVTENQTGVQGCIYPTADNYNALATDDDGTCLFTGTCPGDFDDDGLIGVMDILYLLGIYNTPCE